MDSIASPGHLLEAVGCINGEKSPDVKDCLKCLVEYIIVAITSANAPQKLIHETS